MKTGVVTGSVVRCVPIGLLLMPVKTGVMTGCKVLEFHPNLLLMPVNMAQKNLKPL